MELYGYDGGDPACKRKEEVWSPLKPLRRLSLTDTQLGIAIPGLSDVADYIKTTEWSALA